MRYLNGSIELNREFERLMTEYAHYHWMVAWAGLPDVHAEVLAMHTRKIERLVIGLHFYQTSPEFIAAFNHVPGVRFIKVVSGVFHPKIYLFINDKDHWEVLIGSANFTNAAFNKNNETCLLVHSEESPTEMLEEILNSIEQNWQAGTMFTDTELQIYARRAARARERRREDEQDGMPDGNELGIPVPVRTMTWQDYIDRIFEAGHEIVRERLRLLDIVRGYFGQFDSFAAMPPLMRKQIGGYIWAGQPVNFKIFGNMQNARRFKHVVNTDPARLSAALDEIPSDGQVREAQFIAFADGFNEALGGGNKYRSGTRLLAMKRPDFFFALSDGNNARLAQDFGIEDVGAMNFTRYWNEVVLPMQESEWWRFPAPINEMERRIVPYRAAFMDAMYYHRNE